MQTRVHKVLLPRLAVWLLSIKITDLMQIFFSQASSRGIKNTYSLEQKKKKQEEIEKRIAASGSGGEGGLRVSLKMKQYDATVLIFTEENPILFYCCLQDWIMQEKNKRKGNGIEIEACVMYSQADFISGMQGWQRALFSCLSPSFCTNDLILFSFMVLSALGNLLPDLSVPFQYLLRLALLAQSLQNIIQLSTVIAWRFNYLFLFLKNIKCCRIYW